MRIVLHIGSNKTGSSAIQSFLYQADSPDFCYPIAGQDLAAHHQLSSPEELAHHLPEIEREADGYPIVILSSETFHTSDPRPLADLLAPHQVTVIAYVREHLSYLSSWYRESVKSTSTSCSFEQFAYFSNPQNHLWLSLWRHAFPQDFRVFAYDLSRFPNGSVVDHFLSEIEFSGLSRQEIYANPSISGNLLFAKRLANLFFPAGDAHKYPYELQVLSQVDPTFSGPLYIDPQTIHAIHSRAAEDRDILRKHFGIDFSELEPVPHGSLAPDLDRWDADRTLIIEESGVLGLNFGYVLQNLATKNFF